MAKRGDGAEKKLNKKARRASKSDKPRKQRAYRRKQKSSSIYFLLWAILSGLSLVIVLLFGVTQQTMMLRSFKYEASREVSEKGKAISEMVSGKTPDAFGGNYSGYLRFLSKSNGVDIYILSEDGKVLFPREPNFDPNAPEVEEMYDFSEETQVLLERLEGRGQSVVYEGEDTYVYGERLPVNGGNDVYLYVEKSLELASSAIKYLNVRMVLISVFIFVLVFAVSSAAAGWFVKPMTQMTEKAKLLAQGRFDVDFHGEDYGLEIYELADTLNYARDELAKTDEMQKQLIANVSHDFKTPLTMIKAYSSMIMEISGDIPEKRNKHAQVIVDEADRLASLVNDILDISKMRSGLESLRLAELDMSSYVYEILDRFAYLKETQGYRFIVDIDDGLYTRADELKIGQVLYNLIGNAVNYTGEDKTVFVSLKKENQTAFRFSVRDTGSGIKSEELSSVWDRYYRSSETHKRPVKGTGLGLSIVKTVLQRHDFLFGVDSRVGEGSTFFVVFPLLDEGRIS